MPRIPCTPTLACALLCALAAAGGAAAEPPGADAEPAAGDGRGDALALAAVERRPRKRYDYSRFSNGPRRVPRPRGASLARAQRLGIGDLERTREILRGRIDPELRAAVPGPPPETLLWPVVDGRWGRGFGYTRRVRTDLRHNGVDLGAPAGAVVRAAAAGLVIYSDNTLRGMGNAVVILHPGGLTTLYAHNQRTTVQPGWRVQRGERVALVGATGIARGPHLHFELRDHGRLRDPKRLFRGRRSDEVNGPLVPLDGRPRANDGADGRAATAVQANRATGRQAEATEGADAAIEWPFALGDERAARTIMARPPRLSPELQARLGRPFSDLLWPVKGGRIGRGYGAAHRGIDVSAEKDAAVRAAADGLVVYAGNGLPGYGRVIVLLHRRGWVSVYGSNAEIAVQAGQRVLRGEWMGRVGGTADAPEPHLHFEWRADGQPRDPSPHFAGRPAM